MDCIAIGTGILAGKFGGLPTMMLLCFQLLAGLVTNTPPWLVLHNPYIPAIVTGFIRLLGTLIGTALIKRYGRKPLMTISAILMGVFMASLAVTVFYKDKFYDENCLQTKPNATLPDHCSGDIMLSMEEEAKLAKMRMFYDIYPAVSVILYMLVFGAGVGTIPWLLLGELCPDSSKVSSSS